MLKSFFSEILCQISGLTFSNTKYVERRNAEIRRIFFQKMLAMPDDGRFLLYLYET